MKLLKVTLVVMLMVLFSYNALALGVSPGRATIMFEPNAKHVVSFNIINDQHKDLKLLLTVEGDAENVTITMPQQIIEMNADEQRKKFSYEVQLPNRFNKPGTKEIRVKILELPPEEEQKPMQVMTRVGVITQLRIIVPYEGKYLNLEEMEVNEVNEGETATFILPVTNLGTEDITKLKANITILGPTNEVIATVSTPEISLAAKTRTLLKANWQANVNPGKYYAIATVYYDGKMANVDKVFNVGSMGIDIVSISNEDFKLGGIAKLDIAVRSNWNEKLENVYAKLLIKNEYNDQMADIKTASIDLLPNTEDKLHAFWDTTGLNEGIYYATLMLYQANNKLKEKQYQMVLTLDKLEANMLGLTAKASKAGAPDLKKSLITFAIVLLIIINASWFFYFKRRQPGFKYEQKLGMPKMNIESKIKVLEQNLRESQEQELEMLTKLNKYKKMHSTNKLSYTEYEYLVNKLLQGKPLSEWTNYYKNYRAEVKNTLKELKKEIKKSK